MNFLEDEVAKYERRVKRIKENPDPHKLKSNLLLYEMWLDFRKRQLKDWKEGVPFAYLSGGGVQPELFRAMGFQVLPLPMTADRAGSNAPRYFEIARQRGYPDNTCDRIQVEMGLAFSGEWPPPSFVTCFSGECLPITYGSYWIAEHFKCATYAMDFPIEDRGDDGFQYLLKQFRELVSVAETVPGIKFDEAKLGEYQRKIEANHSLQMEIYELKKQVPCPISGKDALRMAGRELLDDPRYIEYYELIRKEMRDKIERGIGALPEEKARVMWVVSAPFYADPFSFLESRGVAVPVYDAGMASGERREYVPPDDEKRHGRRLSPLEYMAFTAAEGTQGRTPGPKAERILKNCRELHLDGVIYFMLSGCMPEIGCGRIVADRLEEELGIPTLLIDGYCLDSAKYNQTDFESKLDAFVSVLLARKGIPA